MSKTSRTTTQAVSSSGLVHFFVKLGIFVLGLRVSAVLLLALALALAWPNLPDLSAMTDYRPRVPLRIYTADKVLIGEFGEERRTIIPFNEIPDVMKSAILAAEDDRSEERRVGKVAGARTNRGPGRVNTMHRMAMHHRST